MTTSAPNVLFVVYNLAVIVLIQWCRSQARAYVHPQYTTLRSGPVLYILFRSTIMVSMWSGSCWAVILSLLFAEFSAACLRRHRKQFEMFI